MNSVMEQNIKHHLPDDILMAYAAGTLPEAFNLMVATHVSMCDTCRAQVESFDAVGGEMLAQEPSNDIVLCHPLSYHLTDRIFS